MNDSCHVAVILDIDEAINGDKHWFSFLLSICYIVMIVDKEIVNQMMNQCKKNHFGR